MPEARAGVRAALRVCLPAAAILSAADAFLWIWSGHAGLAAFLLLPFGGLPLTPFGYAFLFWLGLGGLAGLVIGLLDRFLFHIPAPWNRAAYALAGSAGPALLVGLLRSRLSDGIGIPDRYTFGLAATVAALILATLIIQARPARKTSNPGRAVARIWPIALPALLVFAAPFADKALLPRAKAAGAGPGRPNVLILMLDTLRADAVSALNPKAAPTPALDRLAAQGILYRRAIAPASWTVPSHASLFSGLFLSQHGTTFAHQAFDPGVPALAAILAGEGYRTAAFSENPNIAAENGFGRGFREFSGTYLSKPSALLPMLAERVLVRCAGFNPTGEYTADTLRGVERWIRAGALKAGSPPFLAFVNLMAPHLPDWPRLGYSKNPGGKDLLRRLRPVNAAPELNFLPPYALTPTELSALRGFYDGDAAYLDARLDGFLRFLQTSGILDDTLVVVVSDHGENFGEHGLIEHAYCLYNTVLHVPLIMRYPSRIPAGSFRNEPVSAIGLLGTILDLADVPDPRRPAGAARLPLAEGEAAPDVFAESENCAGMIRSVIGREPEAATFDYRPFDRSLSAVYSGDRKLVLGSDGRAELYDLATDWAESRDLAAAEPETMARLRAKIEAWRAGLKRYAPPGPEPKVPQGVKDALKSLGYIR
jgi:arylsulfatase A-like enzyme